MSIGRKPFQVFDFVNYLLMSLVFIIMVYPFWYVMLYSISRVELLTGGLIFLPRGITFSSYLVSIQQRDIITGIINSVTRSTIGPSSMLVITGMAGYVMTKNEFIGVKFFRKFFVFTMYFSGGLIPTYMLMKALNLTDNYLVYIVPVLLNVFNLILIKTYIESLPKSLEESAYLDGANELIIFFKIVFPLSIPIFAAVGLFGAIGQWNSFIDTMLYNSMNSKLFTLQYVLYNMLANQTKTMEEAQIQFGMNAASPQTLKMAITVITVIPIVIAYPFVQRYFISGLLIGAVKS